MPPPELNDRVIYAARGQALPPSPARLARALDGPSQILASEYEGPLDSEPASPNVAAAASQIRPKNTKKTADVRWTDIMKDKLVQQVYYVKAYKRTNQTKEQKFTQIQNCLEADRDFEVLAGTGKCWETFKSQWDAIFKKFKAKYAIDAEGSNLSILNPDVYEQYTGRERILHDIALEIEQLDESKREKSEKEKKIRSSCLTHEKRMLENMSTAPKVPRQLEAPDSGGRDSVASGLTDDHTTAQGSQQPSVRSILDSFMGSGALHASPSKEELNITKLREENEQLRLKMALEGMKLASRMTKLQSKKRKRRKHSKRRSGSSSSSSDSSDSDSSTEPQSKVDEPQSSSSMTA
jgi:hypothetical protein